MTLEGYLLVRELERRQSNERARAITAARALIEPATRGLAGFAESVERVQASRHYVTYGAMPMTVTRGQAEFLAAAWLDRRRHGAVAYKQTWAVARRLADRALVEQKLGNPSRVILGFTITIAGQHALAEYLAARGIALPRGLKFGWVRS